MATSSSIHPEARNELRRLYHEVLTREEKEALAVPVDDIKSFWRTVTHHNFAYQYSTTNWFGLDEDAGDRITSYHWGDAYCEKDMLELLYTRLPHRRP